MTPFIKATMLYITAMDLSALGDFDAKHGDDDLEAAVVFNISWTISCFGDILVKLFIQKYQVFKRSTAP